MNEHQNPHTMVMAENRRTVTCAAEGCSYIMTHWDIQTRTREQNDTTAEALFMMHHRSQYEPGRAPDITVEWEISAYCSVCEDGIGDITQEDTETVYCRECGTTWSADGKDGERKENDND